MKNMFHHTDLSVFQVIHKLVEHPKWSQIESPVIKAYVWLMHSTNREETVTHDLTDKAMSAAVGISEDYVSEKLRPALADLGLVGWVRNQRGKGYKYFVLDPDTGFVIDPSSFNAAKLSVAEIRRYYRTTLENLDVTVNTADTVRKGQTLLVAQCPLCRRNGKGHFEVKLDEGGEWHCFDCNQFGDMLRFQQIAQEHMTGRKVHKNHAAVALSRFLKTLDKKSATGVTVPLTDEEISAALEADEAA